MTDEELNSIYENAWDEHANGKAARRALYDAGKAQAEARVRELEAERDRLVANVAACEATLKLESRDRIAAEEEVERLTPLVADSSAKLAAVRIAREKMDALGMATHEKAPDFACGVADAIELLDAALAPAQPVATKGRYRTLSEPCPVCGVDVGFICRGVPCVIEPPEAVAGQATRAGQEVWCEKHWPAERTGCVECNAHRYSRAKADRPSEQLMQLAPPAAIEPWPVADECGCVADYVCEFHRLPAKVEPLHAAPKAEERGGALRTIDKLKRCPGCGLAWYTVGHNPDCPR